MDSFVGIGCGETADFKTRKEVNSSVRKLKLLKRFW